MEGTRSPERVEPPKPKNSKNPKPPLALFSSPLAAGEFHLSQVVDRPPNQPHRATSGKIGPSPRQWALVSALRYSLPAWPCLMCTKVTCVPSSCSAGETGRPTASPFLLLTGPSWKVCSPVKDHKAAGNTPVTLTCHIWIWSEDTHSGPVSTASVISR